MKKRIQTYMDSIDKLLAAPPEDTDWDDEYVQMTHFHEPVIPTSHAAPRIPTGPELR